MIIPLPWHHAAFEGWSIVGLNHYRKNGGRFLFVAMTNDNGRCIQVEGPDTAELWDRLQHHARAISKDPTAGMRLVGSS